MSLSYVKNLKLLLARPGLLLQCLIILTILPLSVFFYIKYFHKIYSAYEYTLLH